MLKRKSVYTFETKNLLTKNTNLMLSLDSDYIKKFCESIKFNEKTMLDITEALRKVKKWLVVSQMWPAPENIILVWYSDREKNLIVKITSSSVNQCESIFICSWCCCVSLHK